MALYTLVLHCLLWIELYSHKIHILKPFPSMGCCLEMGPWEVIRFRDRTEHLTLGSDEFMGGDPHDGISALV